MVLVGLEWLAKKTAIRKNYIKVKSGEEPRDLFTLYVFVY